MAEKTVRNVEASSVEFGMVLQGYEIHMGHTDGRDFEGRLDGAVSKGGNVRGCYLHGLFASDAYRKAMLKRLGFVADGDANYLDAVDQALDELAAEIETHLDVDGLLGLAMSTDNAC